MHLLHDHATLVIGIVLPFVALPDNSLRCAPSAPLDNGTIVVCWRDPAATPPPTQVLIHFHGAPETVKKNFLRADLDAVLVVVNYPGLSSAYSRPFQSDDRLFQKILQHAAAAVQAATARDTPHWQRVWISSFSAGFGAVREILKTPAYLEQIDAIIAADSIYAGLEPEQPDRQVNRQHMSDFLRFAALAVDGKKRFVISHSALATPYASTVETADYLLQSLQIPREPDRSIELAAVRQSTRASRGRFLVLGFGGETGEDHLAHLRHIDQIWRRVPAAKSVGSADD